MTEAKRKKPETDSEKLDYIITAIDGDERLGFRGLLFRVTRIERYGAVLALIFGLHLLGIDGAVEKIVAAIVLAIPKVIGGM